MRRTTLIVTLALALLMVVAVPTVGFAAMDSTPADAQAEQNENATQSENAAQNENATQNEEADGGLPVDILEDNGINVDAIQTLKESADSLTGPEVAEIAHSIAGGGPPADVPADDEADRGDEGDRGEQGDKGECGDEHERGPDGERGAQGPPDDVTDRGNDGDRGAAHDDCDEEEEESEDEEDEP